MFALAPRSGLVKRQSGVLDIADRYNRQMLQWRDSIVRQGKEELSQYLDYQKIEEYIKALNGEVWDKSRPGWRSRYSDNYMADVRRESLSSLSQIRPALEISSKVTAYKPQAPILHGYVRQLWNQHNLDLDIVEWVDHALFGTGFLKQVAGYDSFQFSCHGPDAVIPVLCNGKLQESAAVIYRAYKPLSYFINKFGAEKCVGLERETVQLSSNLGQEKYQRPGDMPEYRWDALSPRLRRRMAMRNGPKMQTASEVSAFPVVELMEIYSDDWTVNEAAHDVWVHHPDLGKDEHNYHYIVPPGCRLYPRKRLTIFAGDRLMYDGPSPFWHGQYPFTMLQLNPCVWAPGGIAKYRDLLSLNATINRIGAGVDDTVRHALNRILVGKRGAMPQDAWDAIVPGGKPGDKWLMNPIAQKGDIYWMDSPQIPSYVSEFLRYVVDTTKRRSGMMDSGSLTGKKQNSGGEVWEQMRETMSKPFQLEGRYLEAALEQSGEQLISNILQYSTLDGRLRYLGEDGITWEDHDYDPNTMKPFSAPMEDHWKRFAFKIAPGSSHGSSKMQKSNQALLMYRSGGLSLRGLYEQTEFPANVEEEIKRMQEEHQMGIGVPQGRTPRPTRSQKNGGPM